MVHMVHMSNIIDFIHGTAQLQRGPSPVCRGRRMGNDIGDNSQLAVARAFSRAEQAQAGTMKHLLDHPARFSRL